jgi:hypothetical protein
MNRIERFMKGASFATGAKAVSILIIVGMIALFTTHSPLPIGEVALVPAPVATEQPAKVATVASKSVAGVAPHDVASPSRL